MSTHTCSTCKKRTRKVHDYRRQKIKHLKILKDLRIFLTQTQICLCMWEEIRRKDYFYSGVPTLFNRRESVNVRCGKAKTFKETSAIYGT